MQQIELESQQKIRSESQRQIQSDCELGHGEHFITVLILTAAQVPAAAGPPMRTVQPRIQYESQRQIQSDCELDMVNISSPC